MERTLPLTLLAARVGANQQATAAGGVDDGNDVPAVIQSHRGGDVITHRRCHRGGRIVRLVAAKNTFGRVTGGPSPPRRHPGMGLTIAATWNSSHRPRRRIAVDSLAADVPLSGVRARIHGRVGPEAHRDQLSSIRR